MPDKKHMSLTNKSYPPRIRKRDRWKERGGAVGDGGGEGVREAGREG